MKQYSLKILSKNEKSLKTFLSFFSNNLKNKFNIIQKLTTPRNSKKVITLLKSPHVNKIAQEHFETRIFTIHMQLKSFYLERNLIFLKKNLNKLFQDISINLKCITNKNLNVEDKLLIFYPDNFKLSINKRYKTNLKRSKQKGKSKTINLKKSFLFNLTKFLKVVSIFGEIMTIYYLNFYSVSIHLKLKDSLNSSAVEQRTENP